jgi:excisionase family DNA binding protein
MTGVPYGQGARMLCLDELCDWLNITERHARKLVERDAIPYRKVGHLLRFPEAEIETWSHPARERKPASPAQREHGRRPMRPSRSAASALLPKSLID